MEKEGRRTGVSRDTLEFDSGGGAGETPMLQRTQKIVAHTDHTALEPFVSVDKV